MMDRTKRGNGSTLIPYLHFLNHVSKVHNSKSVIDNGSPKIFDKMKPRLDHTYQRGHLRR